MVWPRAGLVPNRNCMVHSGAYRKLSNLTLDGHRGCSQKSVSVYLLSSAVSLSFFHCSTFKERFYKHHNILLTS